MHEGVAECAYMETDKDVVFLKSRKGFVKLALQHGNSLAALKSFSPASYVPSYFDL